MHLGHGHTCVQRAKNALRFLATQTAAAALPPEQLSCAGDHAALCCCLMCLDLWHDSDGIWPTSPALYSPLRERPRLRCEFGTKPRRRLNQSSNPPRLQPLRTRTGMWSPIPGVARHASSRESRSLRGMIPSPWGSARRIMTWSALCERISASCTSPGHGRVQSYLLSSQAGIACFCQFVGLWFITSCEGGCAPFAAAFARGLSPCEALCDAARSLRRSSASSWPRSRRDHGLPSSESAWVSYQTILHLSEWP